MREKGLTKSQLQYLAIFAMVIDHTAWGFVEFMTPLGITMHLFGRLTLPIMCFFIAEGYAHTHDLKKYILRMIVFAVVSILPFYLFFHEEYGYRQNIIFDELLALLALCVINHQSLKKPVRILLLGGLFMISALIGGWVIMPIIYALVFYKNKEFKDKAKWFCFFTVLLFVTLATLILINRKLHFIGYDWSVTQWIYLLGFMFALIPLSFYNGKKGTVFPGRYFFYGFYPAHFMVLWGIKMLLGV